MASGMTKADVGAVQKSLEAEVTAALGRAGLSAYELESLVLKPKADSATMGLLPGCELKCELVGFPPKLECRVVCG